MPTAETVIITGSSGFIGSALVNKLAGRFALVGFDRAASRQPPSAAECVCIDLTSEEAIAAALQRVRTVYGGRIASVVHLAVFAPQLCGKRLARRNKLTRRSSSASLDQTRAIACKGRATMSMMDPTTMQTGMMVGMGLVWLLIIAFLLVGIAAAIKYLRS